MSTCSNSLKLLIEVLAWLTTENAAARTGLHITMDCPAQWQYISRNAYGIRQS